MQAIIESVRAHEISLEIFSQALESAAGNGEFIYDNGAKIKTLRILMDSPHFNKASSDDLGRALESAASNWRDNAVQELIQCSRFHEISTERLNESFYWALKNYDPKSVKAMIQSNRFHEISASLRNHCNSKAELKELLETVRNI